MTKHDIIRFAAMVATTLPQLHTTSMITAFTLQCSSRCTMSSSNLLLFANQQPDKSDLYNDDELFEILNLHRSLNLEEQKGQGLFSSSNEDDSFSNNSDEEPVSELSMLGIHEWVVQAIDDIDSSSSSSSSSREEQKKSSYNNIGRLLRDKKQYIRAIATDIDGTLLAGQYMHPVTEEALVVAINMAYNSSTNDGHDDDDDDDIKRKIQHFFPATGKSRAGAVGSLGPVIGPLLFDCPGVFIQGVYCLDKEGNVVFEKKLSADAIQAAEELVSESGISIVGYDGDNLYTTEQTDVVVSLSEYYGEPTVEMMISNAGDNNTVIKLAEHKNGIHKLLLMDEDVDKLALVRPKLEELAKKYDAEVTLAIPTMLELLPGGCSKADGVQRVCEALGIDASKELLALGDAENDAGMLDMAAIGVAVGNACPQARKCADYIMDERHDEGAAGMAINLFGI